MHKTLLQIFTVLHYFGELIAVGMRQDMVDETVDSILVKDGRVEITFLFHSNCLISQCCFYKENHDSIHIKTSLTFKCLIEYLLADFSYSRPLDTYL